MARNDLGISQFTLKVNDADGVKRGRAYLFGPEDGECQSGADGLVAGVAHYNAKNGLDATIQSEGFAEVESSAAVAIGAPVFVQSDGRVGASGSARLGNATSATDGAGERLTVDLSTKNATAAASGA